MPASVQYNFHRYMHRRHIEGPNGSHQATGVTATRALYEATVRREVRSFWYIILLPAPTTCCQLSAPVAAAPFAAHATAGQYSATACFCNSPVSDVCPERQQLLLSTWPRRW